MFLTWNGRASQTSLIMATSQAISSDGATTTVWKEPELLWPPGPINTPGSRITQALGLTGGSSRDPAAFAGRLWEVSEPNAEKLCVKSAFDIPHKSFKLKIPQLRLPFSNRTVLVNGK